jgi:hypothetical protein
MTSKNPSPAQTRAPRNERRRPLLIAGILLALALIIGGMALWVSARDALNRIDQSTAEIGDRIGDATRLSAVLDVTSRGWMAQAANTNRLYSILKTLTETKTILEATYAVNSLEWLGGAARDISVEKSNVAGVALTNEAHVNLRTEVTTAYDLYEHTVDQVAELIADWNSNFDGWRMQNTQAASQTVSSSLTTYQQLDARLAQSIDEARGQQDGLAAQKLHLQAEASALQTRSTVGFVGAAIGTALLAVVGVLAYQDRRSSVAARHTSAAHAGHASTARRRHK